jgi:hypothetical protein
MAEECGCGAPPIPTSFICCTARTGIATAEPAMAILGGIDAARYPGAHMGRQGPPLWDVLL